MQIIEVTPFGARAAVLDLRRKESPMQFMVFPMVHLADQRFYDKVQTRLADCQIVVAEGIQGSSSAARALTRSYRLLRHKRSLGMAVQKIDYEALNAEVVHPDITGAEMDRSWQQVPWLQRVTFALFVPFYILWMLCLGSRRVIAKHLAIDDLPSPKEQALADAANDKFEAMNELVVDRRDRLLLDALEQIHHQHASEPIKVGVVYGAGHTVVIVRALHKQYGYITRSGEWLDLFAL